MGATGRLAEELRAHALILGEVTLTSGATAQYYVDAKRAILRPAGFRALGELVSAHARAWGATAVGGLTMGADPVACAALALSGQILAPSTAGAEDTACVTAGQALRYVVNFDRATAASPATAEVSAACGETTIYYPQIAVGVATSADPDFADDVRDAEPFAAAGIRGRAIRPADGPAARHRPPAP